MRDPHFYGRIHRYSERRLERPVDPAPVCHCCREHERMPASGRERMRRKLTNETTADLEEIRGTALTSGDQIGKVFIAIGDSVRRCLICNRMFTRQGAGTFLFTATVTDTLNVTATQSLTLTVNSPPSITTTALPTAEVGRPYPSTIAATGGTPPLTFTSQMVDGVARESVRVGTARKRTVASETCSLRTRCKRRERKTY